MTIDDIIFLRDNYDKHKTHEYAKRFGVTPQVVRAIGCALGLTRGIHKLPAVIDQNVIKDLELRKPIMEIASTNKCSVSHVQKLSRIHELYYHRYWTRIETARLLDQIRRDVPIPMIAADHKRPESAIRSKIWHIQKTKGKHD